MMRDSIEQGGYMGRSSSAFHSGVGNELRQRKSAQVTEVQSTSLDETIKAFDFYPKTEDEHLVKTDVGGFLTLLSGLLIIGLICSEFMDYWRGNIKEEIVMDTRIHDKLTINMNITFPNMPCHCACVLASVYVYTCVCVSVCVCVCMCARVLCLGSRCTISY
jgi:hypothetical protein